MDHLSQPKILDDATLAPGTLVLQGLIDGDLRLQADGDKSPAALVWENHNKLTLPSGGSLSAAVHPRSKSSFHFRIAIFLAQALVRLKAKKAVREFGDIDKELDGHTQAVVSGRIPDQRKHGHGLASLASYAQREWASANISCPLEGRIRSLYLATRRIAVDDDEAELLTNRFFLDLIPALYASSEIPELAALGAHNLGVTRDKPASPTLEAVIREVKFTGEYWLKSLWVRLEHDREAYQRDTQRAKFEYAVLQGADGKPEALELARISNPESLLFDLWAWSDFEKSQEKKGFPLVWIDHGWGCEGFELRLDPSRPGVNPLDKQDCLASLGLTAGDDGWSLRFSDSSVDPKASEVRLCLKRGFFCDATFSVEDIVCDPACQLTEKQCTRKLPLDLAIEDSEVEQPAKIPRESKFRVQKGCYRWAQIAYSDDIDIYATWAGDEIAHVLYSVLRLEPEMRMPNDFLKQHVHRQPGLVSVWTRDGLVVAHQQASSDQAEELKKKFQDAANLECELKRLIQKPHGKDEGRIEEVRTLIERHLQLRQDAARAEFRPMRLFLERLHAQEVYDAFRQMEAHEDQQQLLKEQEKTLSATQKAAEKQEETLSTMQRASGRLDWLEIIIFAVYIMESADLLREYFPSGLARLATLIGFPLLGFVLVAQYVLNWKDKDSAEAKSKADGSQPAPEASALPTQPHGKPTSVWSSPRLWCAVLLATALLGSLGLGSLGLHPFTPLWWLLCCFAFLAIWHWRRGLSWPRAARDTLLALIVAIYGAGLISGVRHYRGLFEEATPTGKLQTTADKQTDSLTQIVQTLERIEARLEAAEAKLGNRAADSPPAGKVNTNMPREPGNPHHQFTAPRAKPVSGGPPAGLR